jgi:hypothetical protein
MTTPPPAEDASGTLELRPRERIPHDAEEVFLA